MRKLGVCVVLAAGVTLLRPVVLESAPLSNHEGSSHAHPNQDDDDRVDPPQASPTPSGTSTASVIPTATPISAAGTEFVDALWVGGGEHQGLLKVSATDGSVLFEAGDFFGIDAIAIDDVRGTVWASS